MNTYGMMSSSFGNPVQSSYAGSTSQGFGSLNSPMSPPRSGTPILGQETQMELPMELQNLSSTRMSSSRLTAGEEGMLKSIDTELKRYGYEPIQRVTVQRNGQPQMTYIKARSPLGFYVFVEIDAAGYIKYSPTDLTMSESVRGTSLPISESYKRGAYDDLGNTMVICNEGVCKLDQDPDSTSVRETNFTFISETLNETILPEKSVLAYPIVRMKEIETNPGLVLRTTSAATARLRENAYRSCTNEIRSYMVHLEQLVKNSNTFATKQDQKARELAKALNQLMEYQNRFQQNPPKTNDEIIRQQRVTFNLEDRNDLSILLLNMCAKFKALSEIIKDVDLEVNQLNESLETRFGDLSAVKQPPQL